MPILGSNNIPDAIVVSESTNEVTFTSVRKPLPPVKETPNTQGTGKEVPFAMKKVNHAPSDNDENISELNSKSIPSTDVPFDMKKGKPRSDTNSSTISDVSATNSDDKDKDVDWNTQKRNPKIQEEEDIPIVPSIVIPDNNNSNIDSKFTRVPHRDNINSTISPRSPKSPKGTTLNNVQITNLLNKGNDVPFNMKKLVPPIIIPSRNNNNTGIKSPVYKKEKEIDWNMKKVPIEEVPEEKGLPPINMKHSEDMDWQFNKVPFVEPSDEKKGKKSRRNSRADENKDIDWGFKKVPFNANETPEEEHHKSKSKKEPELITPQRLDDLQNENLKLRRQFRDTKQKLEALKQTVTKQEKQFEELRALAETQMSKEADIMNFLRTIQDSHKGHGSVDPLFDVGELPETIDIDDPQEEGRHLEKENIMLKSKLKVMHKHIQTLEDESKLYDTQLAEFKRLIADSQLSQTFTEVLQRNTTEQTNDMNDPRCDLFTMEKTKV